MAPRPILVTALDAAWHLRQCGVKRVSAATIRQWARRGHIGVHRRGYACYDLREIEKYAGQRGLLDK